MHRLAVLDLNHRHLDLRSQPASRFSWNTSFSHHQARGRDFNLHYVVSGRIDCQIDARSLSAVAGDLLISFPGDVIDYRLTGPLTVVHCHFSFPRIPLHVIAEDLAEWAAGIGAGDHGFESHLILPDQIALHNIPEAAALLEDLPRIAKLGTPSGGVLATATLLRALCLVSPATLQRLQRQDTPSASASGHAYVREALMYISEHLEEPLAVHGLATALGIEADHLGRLCKQALGVSIGTWILRTRMAKARQLLIESTCSIKDVAHAVGYADPLYFTRIFRREMKTAPRAWRTAYGRSAYSRTDHARTLLRSADGSGV